MELGILVHLFRLDVVRSLARTNNGMCGTVSDIISEGRGSNTQRRDNEGMTILSCFIFNLFFIVCSVPKNSACTSEHTLQQILYSSP